MMACAVPMFVLFLRWERRLSQRDGHPLVDFDLFRVRSFRSGLLVGFAQAVGSFPAFFLITLTLQLGFDLDPLETAVATAPIPIGFALGSMVSARLMPRFGRRMLAAAGFLGTTAAVAVFLSFSFAPRPLNPLVLAPALLLLGCNNGTVATSLVNLTLADVAQRQAGSASGVMQMVQQSTSAVGVALVGLLYFAAVGAGTSSDAYVSGLRWAMATMVLSSTAVFVLHFNMPAHVRGQHRA
jgi:predicted MFS family arabinose efflux permease